MSEVEENYISCWRQGHCLSIEEHPQIDALINPEIANFSDFFVALTHSCSITNDSYDKEPFVEYIGVQLLSGKANSSLMRGINPRKLHAQVVVNNETLWAEFNVVHRGYFDRNVLETMPPSTKYVLTNNTKNTLINWLAARYAAPAFPNVFNQRMALVNKEIAKALKNAGDFVNLINNFMVILDPAEDELDENTPYEIEFLLTVDAEISEDDFLKCQEICNQIKAICIKLLEGEPINLMGDQVSIYKENQITMDAFKGFVPYRFDYLSENID